MTTKVVVPFDLLNPIAFGNATLDASAAAAPRTYVLPDASGTVMLVEQQMQNLVALGLAKKAPAGRVTGPYSISVGRFGVLIDGVAVYPATGGAPPRPPATQPVNCLVVGEFSDGDLCCVTAGVWPAIDNTGGAIVVPTAVYLDIEGTVADSPAATTGVPSQYLGMACSNSYDDGIGGRFVLVNVAIGAPS